MGNWRHLLLWRHRLLWSYRIDLFLVLLGGYLLFLFLLGGIYVYSVKSKQPEMERLLHGFSEKRGTLQNFVKASRPLTEQEEATVKDITFIESGNVAFQPTDEDLLVSPSVRVGGKVIYEKVRELLAFQRFFISQVSTSYIYLGNIVYAGTTYIVLVLPIAVLAFAILNVFYSRDTFVALNHPRFVVIILQLLTFIVLPIAMASAIEPVSVDLRAAIERSNVLIGEPFTTSGRPFDYRFTDAAHFTRDVAHAFARVKGLDVVSQTSTDYFIVEPLLLFVVLVVWIACGLWIVRRFGGGLFIGGTATCAAITIVLMLAANTGFLPLGVLLRHLDLDTYLLDVHPLSVSESEGWALPVIVFGLIFVIGLTAKRYRTYLLCTSFIGLVVASCGFFGSIVSVRTLNFISFLWLLLVVVGLTALVEFALRRAMFKFLYEPQ
jgi:hypothetical protein